MGTGSVTDSTKDRALCVIIIQA